MTEKEAQITYNKICERIAERKLKPAFSLLNEAITTEGLSFLTDELRNLRQNYYYMLKYTVEGIKDPARKEVYRKLIISVFELADKVKEALNIKYSTSVEYEKKRGFEKSYITNFEEFDTSIEEFYAHKELELLVNDTFTGGKKNFPPSLEHQQKIVSLFYHIWFRDKLNTVETGFISKILGNTNLAGTYKSLIISGIILSLIRYFDKTKFTLLFEAYEKGTPETKQRAFVGILIGYYKYDQRMAYLPELTSRLVIFNESHEFKKNLEWAILQFIRSKETEKIQQKIRDEIIPEMIKISPNLKNKINLDSLMDDGLSDDKNPEWEEIFKDSPGLLDKMEEFSELQMEGADVFLSSFSMLKSFPFFNELSNWFIPFFIDNPDIIKEIDVNDPLNQSFMKTISSAPILCNSDKYSFCFSLKNLPSENRELLVQGMKAEMDQFSEIGKDEELTSPGKSEEFYSNQYIQDLYRFYRIHPRKSGFEDIFGWKFDFHNTHSLGIVLKEDKKILKNIAEYYFAKNHFHEASEIYCFLLSIEKTSELYQKIAFCHQKTGNYKEALNHYLKAELYELNKLWNLKKIALCYRNLKQPGKALEYYRLAENNDPESLSIQLSIGHCLLELGQFDEALKSYFKVEYLAPGNKKVWRPIAWCSFLTGKKSQALKYYDKLIADGPTNHDYMNMGHVQWSMGNRKEAIGYYKKSIVEGRFSEEEFFDIFEDDLHFLIAQGIDPEDVPIMLDQLRYFLEE